MANKSGPGPNWPSKSGNPSGGNRSNNPPKNNPNLPSKTGRQSGGGRGNVGRGR